MCYKQLHEGFIRVEVLVEDMQASEPVLKRNAHLAESIANERAPFASEGSKAYKEWIESDENEMTSSMLKALVV